MKINGSGQNFIVRRVVEECVYYMIRTTSMHVLTVPLLMHATRFTAESGQLAIDEALEVGSFGWELISEQQAALEERRRAS